MSARARELLILLLGDSVCFITALWLTLLVRYAEIPSAENINQHIGPFIILSGFWLLIYYVAGLYDKQTVFLKGFLVERILQTQFLNVVLAGIAFLIIPFGIAPKTNLVIFLFISSGVLIWWRLRLFQRFSPKTTHRALLIADGEEAEELVAEVNNNERYNFVFVRMIDDHTAMNTPDFESKVLEVIDREGITMIIANPRSKYIEHILPTLFDLAFLKFEFLFLDFYKVYEDTFDRVPLSALRYDWFLEHVSDSRSIGYDWAKRLVDIVGSLILGLFLAVALPFIWLAMRLEGKGPVFITQERIGKYNKPVKVYKLRSMTENDAISGTWTGEDAEKGNQITKVGNILRKTSIDEFPQVLNILKGDMSLIGPRNDIVGLANRLAEEIPYYNIRNFTKPGVTGWAQTHQYYMGNNISPQSIEETQMRLAYDLYYVKNRSFLLDMAIALRTIKTLLSRFGIMIKRPSWL